MSDPADGSRQQIQVCLFDVMGTVVDVDGSVQRATIAALRRTGISQDDVEAILRRYDPRLDELLREVNAGSRPWQGHRDLRRVALRESVAAQHLPPLASEVEDQLSGVIHHLDPWPESAAALRSLQEHVSVVALSNADLAELTGLSRNAGLSWHAVLSGELVHAFKPDPAVYTMALRLLGVAPEEVLMVAAHPWDLRAAAQHGLGTAYVARPGADPADPQDVFDFTVADLAELAQLSAAGWR